MLVRKCGFSFLVKYTYFFRDLSPLVVVNSFFIQISKLKLMGETQQQQQKK